jgi:hypothetical protein
LLAGRLLMTQDMRIFRSGSASSKALQPRKQVTGFNDSMLHATSCGSRGM